VSTGAGRALGDLFADAEPPPTGERFETLLRHGALHVERIVSSTRPDPGMYEQAQDEWVVLLRGTATLEVAGRRQSLRAGEHLFLPSGTPHRVLETSAGALWLAVHLEPPG
jgi:cupin 2 domain-containing protein